MPKKPINWIAIKKRYLQGEMPKDIGADYGLTAKQVSNKAQNDHWTSKKKEITEKVANNVLSELDEIHSLYGFLIKDIAREFVEARKLGLSGLAVQDGEGHANKLAEHVVKAGLASYLEKQKHANKIQLAKSGEPDEKIEPGFTVMPDSHA